MEITSYLLGKKKSGGGGSSGLDWSAIGYSGPPQSIIDGYNYALSIKNSWIDKTSYYTEFNNNYDLMFFPKVSSTKATTTRTMFSNCKNLMFADLTGFTTTGLTRMDNMFNACSFIHEIDMSTIITTNVTNMSNMFNGCASLKKLDIRNFDFTSVTNSTAMFSEVPNDCLIIVHDQTAKEWVLGKKSSFTNVKTINDL